MKRSKLNSRIVFGASTKTITADGDVGFAKVFRVASRQRVSHQLRYILLLLVENLSKCSGNLLKNPRGETLRYPEQGKQTVGMMYFYIQPRIRVRFYI